MTKLKMWKNYSSWEEAEAAWDQKAREAELTQPIKKLTHLPQMVGITPDTSKNLKWKSFKWILSQDHEWKILKGFFKHPLKYGWKYLKSLFKKKSYQREKDFFLYGISSIEEFKKMIVDQESLLVLGFSYCHKPFECPAGRFTSQCIHDPDQLTCRQCFIGKAMNAVPDRNTIPVLIPTIHYIGEKIFDIVHQNPKKKILFIITACEMTLEMFGDLGNMVNIKGVGVRLDGRICNTMQAFELSEKGIKPGLTVVLPETQKQILEFLHLRFKNS